MSTARIAGERWFEMAISDEKRREIAASLRESRDFISGLPSASLEQNAFDTFERILTCVDYEQGNIFDYLADLIDRETCRNVYDGDAMGACDNGFECSVCGNRVEDYEGYAVTGEFDYCSKCGRKVER